MKTFLLSISVAAGLAAVTVQGRAQDIPVDQVPSVVRNNFETAFPKASDIDWEKEKDLYNVEFETGIHVDHEAWYDPTGKLIRHKEDISKKQLPAAVNRMINRDFKDFRVSDLEKVSTDTSTVYKVELDSRSEEWQLTVDPQGKLISKVAD